MATSWWTSSGSSPKAQHSLYNVAIRTAHNTLNVVQSFIELQQDLLTCMFNNQWHMSSLLPYGVLPRSGSHRLAPQNPRCCTSGSFIVYFPFTFVPPKCNTIPLSALNTITISPPTFLTDQYPACLLTIWSTTPPIFSIYANLLITPPHDISTKSFRCISQLRCPSTNQFWI